MKSVCLCLCLFVHELEWKIIWRTVAECSEVASADYKSLNEHNHADDISRFICSIDLLA